MPWAFWMLTRGSPGQGVLNTRCDPPLVLGGPQWCSQTLARSSKRMLRGLARIAATILATEGTEEWYHGRYYKVDVLPPWPRPGTCPTPRSAHLEQASQRLNAAA